jgi:hypothetical protein
MVQPKQRVSDRAHMLEKEISDIHLGGFQLEGSRGWQFIQDLIPDGNVKCQSLIQLARVFSAISGIPFHRDYTRRRALIVKWFDDHIDELQPIQAIVTIVTISPDIQPEDKGDWSLINGESGY